MTIIRNIRRSSSTFIIVVISFFVLTLLGSELVQFIPYFFGKKDQIGKISNLKISAIDYYKLCNIIRHNYKQKGNPLHEEDDIYIKDCAWNYLINDILYRKAIEAAGIIISPKELIDLVQGEHIDIEILEAFKNPKTSTFDKLKLLNYIKSLNKSQQEWWYNVKKQLALKRAKKKLHQLIVQSNFITSLEIQQATKHASLFCNVDYIYIPFTSVEDNLVPPLTDEKLRSYMVSYKNHYKALSESRIIKYITFPIQPDEKDISDFKKKLNLLISQFSSTKDPYTFAQEHTDSNPKEDIKLVCTNDTLPNAFLTIKDTLKEGMVIGPIVNDKVHTLYKLVKKHNDNYEIVYIKKNKIISDHTRNKNFNQLKRLTDKIKKIDDLEKLAYNKKLTIHKEMVLPSDSFIGVHTSARKVVRWLYHKATLGKVSPIFDLENVYLLAIMVDHIKINHLVPLDTVFQEVYPKVLHKEKSKIILDKIKQIEAITIQDIAEQYGEGTTVHSIKRLNFLQNDYPSYIEKSPAFIGSCFGLKINIISNPIIDQKGIFIACVKSKNNEIIKDLKHNTEMLYNKSYIKSHDITKAMKEFKKITDERYKFE